jgi:DNA-binding transcriptional LysR family regulator
MQLVDLEIFITVSEERSMNKASQKMHLAQSAVSARMQNLEKKLGFPLFERSWVGVQLTQPGVRFLKYAIGSISAIRQAEKMLLSKHTESVFQVGATRSLAVKYVPELLSICHNEDASIILETITASSEDILALMRSGALDLGFVYDTKPPAGVHSFPLQQEDVVLVSREPLKSFREFLISDPFVILQYGGNIEQNLEMLMDVMNIQGQKVIARVDNLELLIELVRKGVGNAIIPRSYLQSSHLEMDEDGYIAHKNIYVKKAPSLLPGRTIYVVWNGYKFIEFTEQVVKRFALTVCSRNNQSRL